MCFHGVSGWEDGLAINLLIRADFQVYEFLCVGSVSFNLFFFTSSMIILWVCDNEYESNKVRLQVSAIFRNFEFLAWENLLDSPQTAPIVDLGTQLHV